MNEQIYSKRKWPLFFLVAFLCLFSNWTNAQTLPTFEPAAANNTAATASPITNSSKIRGSIFPVGDVDYYSFTANAGDKVYVALQTAFVPGSSTDPQLTLYASNGTTVIEFDDDNGTFAGLSSSIAGAVIPVTGTYYIKVNPFDNTTTIRQYDLYLRVQSGTPQAEVEGNDTPATANALPANGWVSGNRNPAAATEQDWFSITLAAGESVFLSVDLDPERDGVSWNGRLGFALFGDAGNQILVVDDAGTGDVSPNPNIPSEAMFFTAKDAGTYYVFLDAANAATGGPTATYNISVTRYAPTPGYVNYASTDVTKAIGPANGSVTSVLNIPDSKIIRDVSVRLNLTHALMGDIDATLTAPNGSVIHLFSDIGSAATGGQTQMDASFNDNSAVPPSFTVLKGVAIQPEANSKLEQLRGTNTQGTWTLTLYDDGNNASGGTLNNWSLDILEQLPPAGLVVFSNTDFEANDGGFTHSGTADEWEWGTPATLATTTANPVAAFTTANSGVRCWKTDLDNTYNVSSNQVLESPTYNLTGRTGQVFISWAMKYQMESANFDNMEVYVEEVGGAGAIQRLFVWEGATQTASMGNPATNIGMSSGWGTYFADISSFAGKQFRFKVRLISDVTVVFGGIAIDDVRLLGEPCNISNVVFSNAGVCNDNGTSPNGADDYFTADVTVTFTNPPSTGVLQFEPGGDAIAGGGALSVPVAGLTSPYTFTGVRFKADGTPTVVEMEFSDLATTCVRTATGPTVTSCSTPCSNTVNPVSNQTVCNGGATSAVTFSGNTAGVTYNWTNNNPAIGLAATGSGNIASFTAVNAGTAPVTATITVTSTIGLCTSPPVNFTITVNPTPTVNAVGNQTVCAGSPTTAVTFSGAVPGTVYNWTNSNPAIGLAASGSGNIASFTATNATTGAITGTITVTPSYTNAGTTCTGTPRTFTITVNPTPTVNTVANQSVCAGLQTTAITFSGSIPGATYNWTNNTPSIGLAASGTGNIAAFTAVNTGTTAVVATITVTPSFTVGATTCTGAPTSFTITVNPNPVLSIVADPGTTLCAGDPTLLTVITGTGTVTFTAPPANIAIPGTGTGSSAAPAPAAVYPINLTVSGLPTSGVTVKSVTVSGLSHTWMSDVNILLQSPSGQNVVIMADCGRGGDLANHTLTFDDAAPLNLNNTLGGTDPPASGSTWKPTNLTDYLFPASDPDVWPAPGPGTFGSQLPLSTFTGDMNGVWKMFITDDGGGDVGSINGGYNIVFNAPAGVPTGYTFLWTPATGLSSTTTNPVAASPATTTTYTVTGTSGAGCVRQASITINVNQRPAITAQPVATAACAGSSATFTAAGTGTGATLLWQVSTDGGTTWTNLTNAAPYSGVTTGTLTINPVTIAMNGFRYRLSVSGTCPPTAFSNGAILTVNPLPVVTISPAGPVCGGVAGTNGTLLTASSPTGGNFIWSPATGLYTNAAATVAYVAGTPTATVYAAPAVNTVYTVSATNGTTGCVGTGTVTVNYTPPAPTVNPASATICLGGVQQLTITSSLAPVTVSAASGPVNIAIPDGTGTAAISTLNIAGIPGIAVISDVRVTLNITHTWVGDLDVNIVAPNGARMNLVGGLDNGGGGNGTDNFTGTIVAMTGTTALSGAPAPRTGLFAADRLAGYGPTGYEQTVANWNGLLSTPNGSWVLALGDFAGLDVGTLNSWSLDIVYGVPSGGIWTPATGLYTNAGATVPYVAGTPATTVYASPTVSTTYSVTVNTGTCTSPARQVPVTVNTPVTITAQPVNATVCTNAVATFSVTATGTAPTYQWQVSTNNGTTWTNVTNGGVYSGATSATLTIVSPPVSLNGNLYRVIVQGAAPCGAVTSAQRQLTVNPLPTIVISAAPYTRLFPGLVTTLSSTVTPNAAATYQWRRNGVNVAGGTGSTLSVDVDGLGLYTLAVTDVNGCSSVSNSVLISDSAAGKVFIYPNPNTGRFQVRYYSVTGNTLVRGLTIYDAKGARVMAQDFTITAPYARMDVDMTKFGKGIYWVEVGDRNGNRLAVGRVIIQ